MSAARSRPRDKTAGDTPGAPASPVPQQPVSRRLLLVTFLLAAGWSLALLLMDVWTTGDPVVGPGQVLNSDVVVIAKRVAADQDRVEVERVFKGEVAPETTLRIINLTDSRNVVYGKSYIFALTRFRGDFAVTRLDGQKPDTGLLVYPATPSAIEQTKTILREARGQ
jgi:hypothetical protein